MKNLSFCNPKMRREQNMPLAYADVRQPLRITDVGGPRSLKMRLADMGVLRGRLVEVVNKSEGSVIVRVGTSKLMLDKKISLWIMVKLGSEV
jgi:Fe2+ transport system protein FeoA